ncbi:MAG: DUF4831 family protein [Alistipes sp.]|nr:DUF4831 family protein [Alistipes sp.]
MKRVFGILMLTLLTMASASAQNSIYKAVVGAHKDATGNIVVSDPSTTLAVDLVFETEQVVVGPYAKYAQKYLETRGALVDKSTTSLKSAKLAIVTDNALAAGTVAEPTTTISSYLGSENEFPKISPDRTSSSAMSLDDAAAQAAQAIFTIRKNRMDLISGEAGENVFGGGLKDALEALDAKEQAYLELFLGKKVTTTYTQRVIVPIVTGENEYVIAHTTSGKPEDIKLVLTPSEATPKFSTLSEVDPRDKTAIAVRIANIATCAVKVGNNVVGSASLPIFELGRTAYVAGVAK